MGPTAIRTDGMFNGAVFVPFNYAKFGVATNSDNTLIAATTGKKIKVLALFFVAGASGNVYFTDGSGGAVIFGDSTNKIQLAANQAFSLPLHEAGWMSTSAGNALVMNASSTGPFSGGAVYLLL